MHVNQVAIELAVQLSHDAFERRPIHRPQFLRTVDSQCPHQVEVGNAEIMASTDPVQIGRHHVADIERVPRGLKIADILSRRCVECARERDFFDRTLCRTRGVAHGIPAPL
jgi:hypothetical protein